MIKNIDLIENGNDFIVINVTCGKGTYIRSLARDLALDLNQHYKNQGNQI